MLESRMGLAIRVGIGRRRIADVTNDAPREHSVGFVTALVRWCIFRGAIGADNHVPSPRYENKHDDVQGAQGTSLRHGARRRGGQRSRAGQWLSSGVSIP